MSLNNSFAAFEQGVGGVKTWVYNLCNFSIIIHLHMHPSHAHLYL